MRDKQERDDPVGSSLSLCLRRAAGYLVGLTALIAALILSLTFAQFLRKSYISFTTRQVYAKVRPSRVVSALAFVAFFYHLESGGIVADGVNINIGTEQGSLDRSPVTIGDVAGGNIEKRLADHIWQELQEAKQRIKAIETFLAGSPLGEPGLTSQVREVKADIKRIEREIELVEKLDARLEVLENMLRGYARNSLTVDKYVFYAVLTLLFLAIPATFILIWLGRAG